jgi:hypothetical protein
MAFCTRTRSRRKRPTRRLSPPASANLRLSGERVIPELISSHSTSSRQSHTHGRPRPLFPCRTLPWIFGIGDQGFRSQGSTRTLVLSPARISEARPNPCSHRSSQPERQPAPRRVWLAASATSQCRSDRFKIEKRIANPPGRPGCQRIARDNLGWPARLDGLA